MHGAHGEYSNIEALLYCDKDRVKFAEACSKKIEDT